MKKHYLKKTIFKSNFEITTVTEIGLNYVRSIKKILPINLFRGKNDFILEFQETVKLLLRDPSNILLL